MHSLFFYYLYFAMKIFIIVRIFITLICLFLHFTVIFLPASPASYTHNLVSGTHKFYTCESLNSQNTIENCSKIRKGLLILSWDSLNINHVSPLDSVEPKGK